ncbi:3-isopropylmalate dehydratase small subunit 2 [Fibrobacterota bacterium]
MSRDQKITRIGGTAIPLRGNDVDTDRIIPARYLKCVTFAELGTHVFEDDRRESSAKGQLHAFDNEQYRGAEILFVNNNFGCGSSREHAPQSLMRWGIKGIIGESFAEIFFGNCVSLGIPCATLPHEAMESAMDAVEQRPDAQWTVDIELQELSGPVTFQIDLPPGPKSQFLAGTWNPLHSLLENKNEIEQTAAGLPYLSNFQA